MALFRKKPVEIEAFQWRHPAAADLFPEWANDAVGNGKIKRIDGKLIIETLEGPLAASDGDWIIQGVKGEIYPCKPDIFAATYEAV